MAKYTRLLKTAFLKIMGPSFTVRLQAVRFAYRVATNAKTELEFKFVSTLLSKGDVVVDVGANGADWTTFLSRAVGPSGTVFAFEADPYYAKSTLLAIKLLRLRNVKFFSFGLSETNGFASLRIVDSSGIRMSGETHVDPTATAENQQNCKIELRALSSMVDDFPDLKRMRFMKLDVEGFEFFVLKGAHQLLRESRPSVVLEVGNFEKFNYTEGDIWDFFNELDYVAFTASTDGKLVKTDRQLQHPLAAGVNRLLVPRERENEVSQFTS